MITEEPDYQFRDGNECIVLRVPQSDEFGNTHVDHCISAETALRLYEELCIALNKKP